MAVGWIGVAAGLVVLASGCGSHSQSADQMKQVPGLKQLALFYGFHVREHQGKPPADEAAFKAYIKSLPAERLQQFKIENIDSMFVSPRDSKPYVVMYGGKAGSSRRPGAAVPVAWEQEGKGGKRFVVDSLGKLEEVDEATFKKMVPNERGK
jgi:hypothetical protein